MQFTLSIITRYFIVVSGLAITAFILNWTPYPTSLVFMFSIPVIPSIILFNFTERKLISRKIKIWISLIPSFILILSEALLIYFDDTEKGGHIYFGLGNFIVFISISSILWFEFIKNKYLTFLVILTGISLVLFNLYWTTTHGFNEPYFFMVQ